MLIFYGEAFAQLEVYDNNYLSYNNKPQVLIGATNTGRKFHVKSFDVAYVDTLVKYNCNHTWIMMQNYYQEPFQGLLRYFKPQIE